MKIKTAVLLTSLCSIFFPVIGGVVTVQDAQIVALNFFKTVALNQPPGVQAVPVYKRMEDDGVISLYVFDMLPLKAFVIVSASDNDAPIIGYSTQSNFCANFSTIGLNEWLARWGREIDYVENNHILAVPKDTALWSDYRQGITPIMNRSAGIGPLCSTTWNQSGPTGTLIPLYNEDCPYDNIARSNTLTGCVATAMAQIMKYWNYPPRGMGIVSYDDVVANGFSNNYGEQIFNFNTTPFNWSAMPDSLGANSTSTEDSAVSLLNYACGVSVLMDYGPSESGAWVLTGESTDGASSQQAYSNYFKYDASTIQAVKYGNYSTSDWISLLENELNAVRPIQYQGFDSAGAGAHTWVCDGYNTSDMFHMNWGFGGIDDGWYTVTSLDPTVYHFTYDLAALIGIQPGVEATAMPPAICLGDTSTITVSGAPSIATYLWTPSAGLSCTSCANPKAFPTVTTIYAGTIDSGGTSVTVKVTVSVNRPGILNYTLSDSQICNGNSATLSLVGESGVSISPLSSVLWLDSLQASLIPDSTTTYLVTSESSVCRTRDSSTITLQVTQYLPVSLNLNSNIICLGSSATLSYSGLSDPVVTPPGYSYSSGNNVLVFYPSSTTFFTVNSTTSCGSAFMDTFTISVNPDSGALSYALSKSTICAGDTSLLTVSEATNVQVAPANPVTAFGNNMFLLTPDSNTTFYVSGYNAGCGGQATAQVPVKVIQANSISYAVANQDVCAGAYEYIYLYGVTGDIESDPPLYFYFSDSTDAYAYFVADSAQTYNISATTICGVAGTASVQVVVLPQVLYNLQQGSVCQGDSTLFTVAGLSRLSIYPDTGFTIIDSGSYQFHPSSTTSYTVNGYDCNGAYYYYAFTVNVAVPGVLDYTLTDSNLCSEFGTEVKLNGVYDPQINPDANLYMTDSADYYATLYPTTTTTYTISGQSICGGQVFSSFTVHVYNNTGFILGSHSVCPGGSTTLTLKGLTDPAIYPSNTTVWINDSVILLSPTSATDYELSGTDCTGNEVLYEITVGILPGTNLTFTVDSEICGGNSSYLSISGATNINLIPTVSLTYTDSFDAYTYLYPNSNTHYIITGTSQCTNANDTAAFNIYVVEDGSYTLSSQSVCSNDSVIIKSLGLNDMAISPEGSVTYVNSNWAYLYPANTTTYTISGTSSCTGAPYSQGFTITVEPAPSGALLDISESNDTLFASNESAYQWMVNDSLIPGAINYFIVPVVDGKYTVSLTGKNNCSALSEPYIYDGINGPKAGPAYLVYPNPSASKWIIQSNGWSTDNTCEVFDDLGRIVYHSVITSRQYEIDADLSPGLYLLKIIDSDRTTFQFKLIRL